MKASKYWVKNGELVEGLLSDDFDYLWNDFDLSNIKDQKYLKKSKNISKFVIASLLAKESRPRIESYENGILIILRGINFNTDENEEDMVSLRIWVQKDKVITTHFRPIQTLTELSKKMLAGSIPETSSAMLANIISELFQKIETTIIQLDNEVDLLEETIIESRDGSSRFQITLLRKKIVLFKRHLLPQREVISQLRGSTFRWLHDDHRNYHNENYERVMRNLDSLEVMRDKLNIMKEEEQYLLSERLNKNTYVFSVIAAIFLPLGFLTGLLGINLGGIPGAENSDSFWIFCGLLIVVVILQVIIFRKMKWF